MGVSNYVIWGEEPDSIERAIRSAAFGLIFGLLMGAQSARVIQARRQSIGIGLLFGVIVGAVFWLAALLFGFEMAQDSLRLLVLSLLIFSFEGLVFGALIGFMFFDA
jgi:hypothetical protein